MPFAHLKTGRFHYEVFGDKQLPAVLLIMGLGMPAAGWPRSFISMLLEKSLRVITVDNRDAGLSEHFSHLKTSMSVPAAIGRTLLRLPVQAPYLLEDMALDLVQLLDELSLQRAHVVGASMGGMIAQIVAARYPSLVQRMALMFTTTNRAFLKPPKPKQLYTLINRPESHSERDIVRHSVWFMKTVGTPGHVNVRMVRDIAKIRYQRNFHPLGTVQQLNAILASGSISKYSKQVKAPTIVLHGSADGLLPASQGRVVAKTIPNASFHLIEGMAHDIPEYYQPYMVDLISKHLLEK